MQPIDIWAMQQAQEIITMVKNISNETTLLDLVKDRVLVIEARGALREANEERSRVINGRIRKA